MIDFRYHVVSIVAVFLSLAIGLVLGANALQEPVLHGLTASNRSLHNENSDLRSKSTVAGAQLSGEDKFSAALAPGLVENRLKGQSVLFVQSPGGSTTIYNQLKSIVAQAGATVTGEVTVQSDYLQQTQLTKLYDLTMQVKPTAMVFADGASAYDKAGAVLASALLTRLPSEAGTQDTNDILSAFTTAGFISTSSPTLPRATMAIMIPPSVPDKTTATDDNKALVPLAGALGTAGVSAVMAGPLTAAQDSGGGTITAVRGSSAAGKISTVDSADSPTAASGQIVVVLALQNQLQTGKAGAYGTGTGASGYFPAAAVTASPSPSSTPSSSASSKQNKGAKNP